MDMELIPIGVINSQYLTKDDAPRQGRYSTETSTITVFDEFLDGLDGLDLNKYLIFLFSTRAPVRPNPIGFCLIELVDMNKNKLIVKWLDALDGSPLLDIKPFWKLDLPDIH